MKKLKLIPSVLMLVLCVGILAIGVYAASPITGTIAGTINITAAQGVKIAVYRGAGTTDFIDSAFGSAEVELAAGGATLDAGSATSPEEVEAQVYTIVLSTNQDINYVVDTETIEVIDGVGVTSGDVVSGAAVITKLHKPYTDDEGNIAEDENGNACFTKDKPYTIQMSVQCGKISTEAISVSYDIEMTICTEEEYAGTGVNGVDYLYFGEFPQEKSDETTDFVATGDTFNGCSDSTGGSEERAVYSKNGKRYVGMADSSGTMYYYEIQPLKWRILSSDKSNGTTMLMCDTIVEQVYFQVFYEFTDDYYSTDSDGNILQENGSNAYANNYNVSTLRNYLIDTFYNGAFSTSEQVIIKSEEGQVDNSASTQGADTNEEYACANTDDPVFALSVADVINTEYGFAEEDERTSDDTRVLTVTDYANATGAYRNSSNLSGCWWLRSPYNSDATSARCVDYDGLVDYDGVHYDGPGCVPALLLGL